MSHYKPDPTKNVNLTIDGLPVTVPEGTTILEAARHAGVQIPTLCDHPDLGRRSVCRLCVVEVDGRGKLMAACANDAAMGMKVVTNNARIVGIRKTILELILANHPQDCLNCIRNKKCELQRLAALFGIRSPSFRHETMPVRSPVSHNGALVRDMNKCVKCGRCVEVCQEVQTVRAINSSCRGLHYEIGAPYNRTLTEGPCVYCGQCATVCPVGALYEQDDTAAVWPALNDPARHVVIQTAPSMREALEEEFGLPPGAISAGKMVTALKRLGFDKVFDTGFSTEVAVREEAHELADRLKNGGVLPMLTSCSPGWVSFAEHFYPDLLDHLSTTKTPQQIFGALVKTWYPQVSGLDPSTITSVSAMPCIAKKAEARRPGMDASGFRDVDLSLTTPELARMITLAGIDLTSLPESPFDPVMGSASGAGTIVGSSGAMMNAILQTVYETFTGKTLDRLDFETIRDQEGIKQAELDLGGKKLKALVVNGLANARRIMDSIRSGECDAAFIEIVSCPGGSEGLYCVDQSPPVGKAQETPGVKALYEGFLGEPLGEKSRRLLHTRYSDVEQAFV